MRCLRRRDGEPEPPPRRQRDDHGHRAHGEAPRDVALRSSRGAIASVPRALCVASRSLPEGERPGGVRPAVAPCSRRAAQQCATVCSAPALCRGGPRSAKSGRNPALSRNGEAPAWGRAQPPDLGRRNQSLGGRAVRSMPIGCRIGRTSSSAYRWRMIEMFTRYRRRRLAASTLLGAGAALALSGVASASFPVSVHAAERHRQGHVAVPRRSCRCRPPRPRCSTRSARATRSRRSTLTPTTRRVRRIRSSTATTRTSEGIANYKPDLVVVSDEPTERRLAARRPRDPGVSDPAAANLSQAYAAFEELGKLTGHEAQARPRWPRSRARSPHIVASVHRPAHPLTYYYELDQTYYSATLEHVHRAGCSACSACTTLRTRRRGPRRVAATRS